MSFVKENTKFNDEKLNGNRKELRLKLDQQHPFQKKDRKNVLNTQLLVVLPQLKSEMNVF